MVLPLYFTSTEQQAKCLFLIKASYAVPLFKHHAMKTCDGMEVQLHAFITFDTRFS